MKNSPANNPELPIRSPCISNCCLDDEDVCLGCFRHIDEIVGWHSASESEKSKIINNCNDRIKKKLSKN